MKNLFSYISPQKRFNPEHRLMVEVQIDNSLDYWDKNDIVLLTNFPFEYHGIKAVVGPDSLINKTYNKKISGIMNSKINSISYLLKQKIITELTWEHDLDCFQIAPLDLPPIEADIGVTGYGIFPESKLVPLGKNYDFRVNFGSVFFKPESRNIYQLLLEKIEKENLFGEDAMTIIIDENPNIRSRIQFMNQTYNIGMRYVRSNIAISEKPIRVLHFPPNNQAALSRFSRIMPKKLSRMLNDRFNKTI